MTNNIRHPNRIVGKNKSYYLEAATSDDGECVSDHGPNWAFVIFRLEFMIDYKFMGEYHNMTI